MRKEPFGLYVHIPFCSALCHYFDFAKTANYDSVRTEQYFSLLKKHLSEWKAVLKGRPKFTSVFFGGGTPGLFTSEYSELMALILDMALPEAEITLEANLDNVTLDTVKLWRSLGFNRLSIGVQTFDHHGLKDLTRHHTREKSLDAILLAAKYFPKSNGDLIYGWKDQTLESWENDLNLIVDSGVGHISLYALTYEGQTPFARAEKRGVRKSMSDEGLAERYEVACQLLKGKGFIHDEISNWAKEGSSCDHNWLYWRGQHYLGIGAGAHGFLDDGSAIGLRYSYPSDFRTLLRGQGVPSADGSEDSLANLIEAQGGSVDKSGDLDSWKLEYVGCGLRCKDGVNLNKLAAFGFKFQPNAKIKLAIEEGLLCDERGQITLQVNEWFRETAWSYEICDSLTSSNKN